MTEEFCLPQRASVDTAQDLLSLALNVQSAEGDAAKITLDASEVESIDGPTTLILANIAKTFAARESKVSVKSPSKPFVDAFSDLGLYPDLMKMEFVK